MIRDAAGRYFASFVVQTSQPVFASAGIGVAVTEVGRPLSPTELLHQADMAMFRAKSIPGDSYRIHAPDPATMAGPMIGRR